MTRIILIILFIGNIFLIIYGFTLLSVSGLLAFSFIIGAIMSMILIYSYDRALNDIETLQNEIHRNRKRHDNTEKRLNEVIQKITIK